MIRLLCCLLAIFAFGDAHAHRGSESFLSGNLNGAELSGEQLFAVADLDVIFQLDDNGDGKITWGEVRRKQSEILAYAQQSATFISGGTRCERRPESLRVAARDGIVYLVVPFKGSCAPALQEFSVRYDGLFEIDALHRSIVSIGTANKQATAILTTDRREHILTQSAPAVGRTSDDPQDSIDFKSFVLSGISHVALGLDHLVFILLLVLSAARTWPARGARNRLTYALRGTAIVASAFTLGHSLSLALAVTGLLRPPSAFVELAIAVSICITAADLVRPFLGDRRWLTAAGFGLVHGFGLAIALVEQHIAASSLFMALLGFNLGVELAQLGVLLVLVPAVLFLTTRSSWNVFLRYSALASTLIGLVWVLERAPAVFHT